MTDREPVNIMGVIAFPEPDTEIRPPARHNGKLPA